MHIRNSFSAVAFGLLAGLGLTTAAAEIEVTRDYLVGTWTFEGTDRCGKEGVEHLDLSKDGTLRLHRGQQVDAVGFWEASSNRVDVHVVASPHRITGALYAYKDLYDYGNLAMFVFDAEENSFESIVPFAGDVHRRVAHRCG